MCRKHSWKSSKQTKSLHHPWIFVSPIFFIWERDAAQLITTSIVPNFSTELFHRLLTSSSAVKSPWIQSISTVELMFTISFFNDSSNSRRRAVKMIAFAPAFAKNLACSYSQMSNVPIMAWYFTLLVGAAWIRTLKKIDCRRLTDAIGPLAPVIRMIRPSCFNWRFSGLMDGYKSW